MTTADKVALFAAAISSTALGLSTVLATIASAKLKKRYQNIKPVVPFGACVVCGKDPDERHDHKPGTIAQFRRRITDEPQVVPAVDPLMQAAILHAFTTGEAVYIANADEVRPEEVHNHAIDVQNTRAHDIYDAATDHPALQLPLQSGADSRWSAEGSGEPREVETFGGPAFVESQEIGNSNGPIHFQPTEPATSGSLDGCHSPAHEPSSLGSSDSGSSWGGQDFSNAGSYGSYDASGSPSADSSGF